MSRRRSPAPAGRPRRKAGRAPAAAGQAGLVLLRSSTDKQKLLNNRFSRIIGLHANLFAKYRQTQEQHCIG